MKRSRRGILSSGRRLGLTGADCYDAILARDIQALGRSMNECMACWEALLPNTVRHATLQLDLMELLRYYQARYPGAMYSGCGGGYILAPAHCIQPDTPIENRRYPK